MITSIEIQNFKSVGEEPVRLDIKPITLLFGPNSSGKSTLIQVLHLLREIILNDNVNPDRTELGGDFIDLGGFRNFVHSHDSQRTVRISVTLKLNAYDQPPGTLPSYEFEERIARSIDGFVAPDHTIHLLHEVMEKIILTFEIRWSKLLDCPYLSGYGVNINDIEVGSIQGGPDGHNGPVELKGIDRFLEKCEDLPECAFAEYWGVNQVLTFGFFDVSGLPDYSRPFFFNRPWWRDNNKDDETRETDWSVFESVISNVLLMPLNELASHLRDMRYLGPIRTLPPREFRDRVVWPKSDWASGLGAWYTLMERGTNFTWSVGSWLSSTEYLNTGYGLNLQEIFPIRHTFALEQLIRGGGIDTLDDFINELRETPIVKQIDVVEIHNELLLAPHDVGIGISQVLPVVVAALDDRTGLTAIEQPELHIHPAVQVGLGDLFIHAVTEDPSRIFLIETHSEHLMLRLLRRIRQTADPEESPEFELAPDQLSVNYCYKNTDGKFTVQHLRVNNEGKFIDRWPNGFFGERATELFE